MRPRLDEELVRQGFFRDTDEALRSVLAGEVSIGVLLLRVNG